jgi:hypothetical protein
MKLDRANQARRNAESFHLATLLRERNRSGANGTHADKRTRRVKTRRAKKSQALKDWA